MEDNANASDSEVSIQYRRSEFDLDEEMYESYGVSQAAKFKKNIQKPDITTTNTTKVSTTNSNSYNKRNTDTGNTEDEETQGTDEFGDIIENIKDIAEIVALVKDISGIPGQASETIETTDPEQSSETVKRAKHSKTQKTKGMKIVSPSITDKSGQRYEVSTETYDTDVKPQVQFKLKETRSLKKIKGTLICTIGQEVIALAQEPWPKDVKLYQPYEVEQILLPDNANCLAVQAFLRMCNLDFEIVSRANAEFMSPSGKVPFIKCGAFIVSELEGIVQFVNNKGISLTAHLEQEQKSDMRAYMSLVHNVLENAELYLCWCDRETYNEVTKPRNGSVYPWPLNYFQTWSKKSTVSRRLKMMGWYNKTLEDVYQEVENCCQALTDRLEGKEYFFGKRYTELDALVFGHICSILTVPLPADDNRLAYSVMKFDKLIELTQRIKKLVMNEDSHFVVSTYSRMRLAARSKAKYGNNNNNNTITVTPQNVSSPQTENVALEDFDAESVASSSDVNTDDLILGGDLV